MKNRRNQKGGCVYVKKNEIRTWNQQLQQLEQACSSAAGKKPAEKEKRLQRQHHQVDYRNTERGKYEKNSKGIYYTNGNYEAFARPKKPEGVDDKNAYIVGSGLASLAAACFLVRDGQMPGSHITFWKQWILQAVPVTVSLIRPADM